MKNFIKSVFRKPWLIMLGIYIVAFIGILFPSFAQWPIAPVFLLSFALAFSDDRIKWDRFIAIVIGGLSIQILFWIS